MGRRVGGWIESAFLLRRSGEPRSSEKKSEIFPTNYLIIKYYLSRTKILSTGQEDKV